MCVYMHEYEKFMRNGSLHLLAKYLRECGSVVWVVGMFSRDQEVCAKLYLVVSFFRPVQIRSELCRCRTNDPHGGKQSDSWPATSVTKQWQQLSEVNFCAHSCLCAHLDIQKMENLLKD